MWKIPVGIRWNLASSILKPKKKINVDKINCLTLMSKVQLCTNINLTQFRNTIFDIVFDYLVFMSSPSLLQNRILIIKFSIE